MWDSKIVRYLSGALTVMTLTSCTLLLGLSDKQCSTNAECVDAHLGDVCTDHICGFASGCKGSACYGNDGGVSSCESERDCSGTSTPKCLKQSCVNSDVFTQWSCPAQGAATTATVKYGFRVVEFNSREPPDNVVVNACRNGDVYCTQPAATFRDSGKSGNVMLTLPAGFEGFFEIRSALVPALLYVTKPVVKDTQNRDVPVLTPQTVELLAVLAMLPPYDATKGLALLEMIDCTGKPAGGVQFKSSRTAPDQFYVIDSLPSKDAKQTEYDPTDGSADGGFINLVEGFITFSAYLADNGIKLGSFNAQIRANTITYIDLSF